MNKPAVIDDTCEITLQARRFTEQVTEAISNWWEPGEPLSRGPRRKPRGDDPSDAQIGRVVDEFEKTAWAGLEPDRYAWAAFQHRADPLFPPPPTRINDVRSCHAVCRLALPSLRDRVPPEDPFPERLDFRLVLSGRGGYQTTPRAHLVSPVDQRHQRPLFQLG